MHKNLYMYNINGVNRDDMKQVCARLRIPSFEIDFIQEYWGEVFEPFIESYQSGVNTPNPDVLCNRSIKFNLFKQYITKKFGIQDIATGKCL